MPSLLRLGFRVESPRPISKLNKGPAKQPVIAISTKPFFAIDMLAIKSPVELPHARTVKPRRLELIPDITPNRFSKSINRLAVNQIHKILIMKAKIKKGIIRAGGEILVLVVNLMITLKRKATANTQYCQMLRKLITIIVKGYNEIQ
jgi:hypothetical protein